MIRLLLVLAACGGATKTTHEPTPSGEGDAAPFVAGPRTALVGHRAPAATLELLDGSRVDLATLLGRKAIYLKFWATWCKPCREQMPHLAATHRAHADRLAVFAVDVGLNDPIEDVREFVTAQQLPVPVAIDSDGRLAELFHLGVTPQHVLIDRTGIVRFVGHQVSAELEQTIVAIASEAGATAPPSQAPPPARDTPPLALDDGTTFSLEHRAPVALSFVTLWCDTYIAESRPAVGKACAAHARAIADARRARPELTWILIAVPVWTDTVDIADYRKRLGVSAPIGIDRTNAWFRRFGVRDTYTTVVLDASGTEIGRVAGDGAGLAAVIERVR
jgi:peroxiredoxin